MVAFIVYFDGFLTFYDAEAGLFQGVLLEFLLDALILLVAKKELLAVGVLLTLDKLL